MSAERHKTGAAGALSIDIQALRARYRDERDLRLRSEGKAQYVEATGGFARYLDDPWADSGFVREPVNEETEVVIVGGGFGGLLCGARLRAAGITDFRIVEKAADFGGTWYWNRYPGAACDTESYIYLPLLEETGYMPVRNYARAPEIYEHSRRIGRHFGLYERALFQTVISRMAWQEQEGRWLVETDRGDRIRARFVILAGGPLSRPKLPGIPGIDSFKGHSFTPAAGTMPTPAAVRKEVSTVLPTSASASSAPVPPPCNVCRISAVRRKSSTCSSARRRRSVCATTGRPINPGLKA